VYERIMISQNRSPAAVPIRARMTFAWWLVAGLTWTAGNVTAQSPPASSSPATARGTAGLPAANINTGGASGTIPLTGPAIDFPPVQPPGVAQPPVPNPPPPPTATAPANSIPRVIPVEPLPGVTALPPPAPRVIQFPTDSTGMVPDHPPIPVERRSNDEVASDISRLIETVKAPEAEISVVEGQTKIIQSRRELTRIVVSNPAVADVELLTDQPGS
jgi:hypothetical protein